MPACRPSSSRSACCPSPVRSRSSCPQNKMIYRFRSLRRRSSRRIGGGAFLRRVEPGLGVAHPHRHHRPHPQIHDLGPTSLLDRRQRACRAPDRRAGRPGQDAGLHRYRGFTAAVASILIVGWQGSAINALGTSYELRVIASTVIGGANLMGGEGGPTARWSARRFSR